MNVGRTLAAGLIASMVIGMLQMGYGMLAGSGLWAPVVFIAATLLRDLQSAPASMPFLAVPVLLGLLGHMMNSVFGGMAYSVAVFVVMWFGIAPLVDPVMLRVNGIAFFVAHLMWGIALGLVLGWRTKQERQLSLLTRPTL